MNKNSQEWDVRHAGCHGGIQLFVSTTSGISASLEKKSRSTYAGLHGRIAILLCSKRRSPLLMKCAIRMYGPWKDQPSTSVLGVFSNSSRHRRASPMTSPSPSSLSSSSDSTFLSAMLFTIDMVSSDFLISPSRRESSDSMSCSKVQMAMCWNVASPLARKFLR